MMQRLKVYRSIIGCTLINDVTATIGVVGVSMNNTIYSNTNNNNDNNTDNNNNNNNSANDGNVILLSSLLLRNDEVKKKNRMVVQDTPMTRPAVSAVRTIDTVLNSSFDGIVLTLDQLIETAEMIGLSSCKSSSSSTSSFSLYGSLSSTSLISSLLYDTRLICQLEPKSTDDVSDHLDRLAFFLDTANKLKTKITRKYTSGTSKNNTNTNINTNTNSTNSGTDHSLHKNKSILDMVIIRAPSNIHGNLEETINYLSSTLPAASIFLESIDPGSVKASSSSSDDDHCDNHCDSSSNVNSDASSCNDTMHSYSSRGDAERIRKRRRPHVHGVSHHLPGFDLNQLTDIADIFPPARLALDPTNIRSSSDGDDTNDDDDDDNANDDNNSSSNNNNHFTSSSDDNGDDDGNNVPSISNSFGLSREIEGVVQNTDLIRISPSTFQPQRQKRIRKAEEEKEKKVSFGIKDNDIFKNNKSNHDHHLDDTDDNNNKISQHGLFSAGTLFAETWCAQELNGAQETYVICENDNTYNYDDDNSDDDDINNVKIENNTEESLSALSGRIQTAYEATKLWRSEAGKRREEEMKETILASKNKAGLNSWMHKRYSPEIIESARILGLLNTTTAATEDPHRLTIDMIKRRWRDLAFVSHPDTADNDFGGERSNNITTSNITTTPQKRKSKPTFSVLRQHYLLLLAAAREDDQPSS